MHMCTHAHTRTCSARASFKSIALTLMKRDHNKLFSVCLMGCEQNMCIRLCPRVVCLQTVASLDAHKSAKSEEEKEGEAVLNQLSEIVVRQKRLKANL